MQKIKIAKWDDDIESAANADNVTLEAFEQDVEREHFTWLQQREKPDPDNAWAFAVVTGHKYRFHWGEMLDFDSMHV